MLNLSVPALLKIREGITINLNQSVSQAVERKMPQYRIKAEIKELSDKGELKRALGQDDYEQYGEVDTVTIWFGDGKSLSYRVGEEITAEDFARIEGDLKNLEYKTKK